MDLTIATGNRHKVAEMSLILKKFGVNLLHENPRIVEPDFDTLEEIAEYKARQAYEHLGTAVVAEDTGVFFGAYNNFPGPLAKRVYLGIGFPGLLLLIRNAKKKAAHFKTVVHYFDGVESASFSGELHGSLLDDAVSIEKDRLPYEKIFVPKGFDVALADLPIEKKNEISHRAIATKKLGEWLGEQQLRMTNHL
ncbi:MAG: hypothetical protein NUV67_06380 [archaeon]|nr:hypothetical protein [archaeon]